MTLQLDRIGIVHGRTMKEGKVGSDLPTVYGVFTATESV
jgi:hypothetical protein